MHRSRRRQKEIFLEYLTEEKFYLLMDATIKGLPVNEQTVREMFEEICKIELDDDVTFSFRSIGEIREGDLKAKIKYEHNVRVEEYPFVREAIRGAVYNAIAHNCYMYGTSIQIRVMDDAITISNNCILPEVMEPLLKAMIWKVIKMKVMINKKCHAK